MKKDKTEYQLFLDKVKKFELRPGSVKPIHLFREIYDLIEPLWEKIRNIPSTFPPDNHGHVKSDISDFAHKASHENAGGDEISVAGLSGELADDQPPKAHIHDDRYYTEAEIDALLAGISIAKLAYDGGRNCLSLNDSDAQINYDSDYKCLLLDDADEDIEYDADYQCLLITV